MRDAARATPPPYDPAAPLRFVVNAASGHHDSGDTEDAIRAALAARGRRGELLMCRPDELAGRAKQAARQAAGDHGGVVGVGGDGTLNTVAQAAWDAGCAMGALPQGTFNYFGRAHRLPPQAQAAALALLDVHAPSPVALGALNDRVFLVNASLGLYPELLENREAWKARFGRSRTVALAAALATLLSSRRQLRLAIEAGDAPRVLRTLTLFVGNNPLQLERLGVAGRDDADGGGAGDRVREGDRDGARAGRREDDRTARDTADAPPPLRAVVLRPAGPLRMLALLARGALGSLGEADSVEHFDFTRLTVRPVGATVRRRRVKVAFDGEVAWMRPPLRFERPARPLWLLKPAPLDDAAAPAGSEAP